MLPSIGFHLVGERADSKVTEERIERQYLFRSANAKQKSEKLPKIAGKPVPSSFKVSELRFRGPKRPLPSNLGYLVLLSPFLVSVLDIYSAQTQVLNVGVRTAIFLHPFKDGKHISVQTRTIWNPVSALKSVT